MNNPTDRTLILVAGIVVSIAILAMGTWMWVPMLVGVFYILQGPLILWMNLSDREAERKHQQEMLKLQLGVMLYEREREIRTVRGYSQHLQAPPGEGHTLPQWDVLPINRLEV